jgi:3-hydroxyacyl-CoA dehydrogenase
VPAGAPKAARDALALGALQQLAKSKPPALTDPAHAARISPGNLEDDLERAVAASDLVIEAVVERLDIKQALFARIAAAAPAARDPHLEHLGHRDRRIAEGLPEAARARVVGMHFFNPPRYMHLLEVVPSRFTDPAVTDELADFSDRVLGKGVVVCRDTPNFIGNRVGTAEMILTFAETAAATTPSRRSTCSTARSWAARAPAATASATSSASTSSATSSATSHAALSDDPAAPTTTSCTRSWSSRR